VVYYDGCDTMATIFAGDCETKVMLAQLSAISHCDADADWMELTPTISASLKDILQSGSPLWYHFGSSIMSEIRLCLLRSLEVTLRNSRNVRLFLEQDGFSMVSQIASSQATTKSDQIQPYEFLHLYTRARETPTQLPANTQLNTEILAHLLQTLPCSPILPLLFSQVSGPGQTISLSTLPTRLVTDNFAEILEVGEDGLTAVYHGPGENDDDVGVVTSNEPFSSLLPLIYYEVKIQNSGVSFGNAISFSFFFSPSSSSLLLV